MINAKWWRAKVLALPLTHQGTVAQAVSGVHNPASRQLTRGSSRRHVHELTLMLMMILLVLLLALVEVISLHFALTISLLSSIYYIYSQVIALFSWRFYYDSNQAKNEWYCLQMYQILVYGAFLIQHYDAFLFGSKNEFSVGSRWEWV